MTIKKCRNRTCRKEFAQYNSMQAICPECAIKKAKEKVTKKRRKEHKEAKDKIKTRAQWLKEAQASVNKYIRLRDYGQPCISCGRPDDGTHQRHAGHFRTVKAASAVRFNTLNIHGQCAQCNTFDSGNVVEYRKRLIYKIGSEKVEWLESQNQLVQYNIDYLKRLKKIFTKRARKMEKKIKEAEQ